MRVLVLVKATAESEAGQMPPMTLIEAMGRFNAALIEAGVLREGGDGLKPSSAAARVTLGEESQVHEGPFPLTEDLASGFWIWTVKDMAEALDWARRCPTSPAGPKTLELRPIFGAEDFAGAMTEEQQAIEATLRARTEMGC